MARITTPNSASTSIPQVLGNDGDYFPSLTDAGKHFYMTTGGAFIVPADSTYNFPIGTTFVVVSGDLDAGIVSQDWNVTHIWGAGYNQHDAGAGWYIQSNSMATIIKIESDKWMVSGATLNIGW